MNNRILLVHKSIFLRELAVLLRFLTLTNPVKKFLWGCAFMKYRLLRHMSFCTLILTFFLVYVAHAADPTILVLGDSLSASHGFAASQGWVNLLESRLEEQGFPHRVVNASISGDTSQGGLTRFPATLERHQPDIVILELGGNDGLRGLSLKTLEQNLAAIIELSQRNGAHVLLAEMRIPPNYGPRYTQKFQGLYKNLANRYQISLIPFLLDGVADSKQLMQSDGIHPRAEAQPQILDNVWPVLLPVLDETRENLSLLNPAMGKMITGKNSNAIH